MTFIDPVLNQFAAGLFLLRVTAGALFFFQGYDKIFKLGTSQVLDTVIDPLKKTLLPNGAVRPMVALSSWIELICGVLLALGLLRDYALYALSVDLIIVAVMFSSIKAMWDMQFYFPRFVMVLALLLLPAADDLYRLDSLIK
ncbi:MAG: DoxX family protein [Bacteroidota bacterium]